MMSSVIHLKCILSKIINELDLGAEYLTYFMMQFGEKKYAFAEIDMILALSQMHHPNAVLPTGLYSHTWELREDTAICCCDGSLDPDTNL